MKKILVIPVVLFAGFFIHIKGIDWGIPERERIPLIFGDEKTLKDMLEPMLSTHQNIREMQVFYGAPYNPDYQSSKPVLLVVNGKKKNVPVELINSMRSYLLRSYGADEQAVLASLSKMNPSKLDFNPHFFEYGGAYLYPLGAFLKLCEILGYVKLNSDMRTYLLQPEQMGRLYLYSRVFGAILFILSGFIFYALCLRITRDMITALLLTLLYMTEPAFALWSHYLKPYAGGMFWVMCCFYFAFRYMDEKNIVYLVLSSIFAGFSMGNLLSYGYAIVITCLVILLTIPSLKNVLKSLLIIFSVFVLSYLITNPYVLISYREFINEMSYINAYWKGAASIENLMYFITVSLKYGLGAGIWVLFIFFLVASFFRFEKKFFSVLAGILPGFVYFGLNTGRWVHYSLIIYPFIFLIIAIGTTRISRPLSILILIFAALWTFIFTESHVNLFTGDNVRTIAGRWINESIPDKARIGLLEFPSPWRTPPFQYLKYDLHIGPPQMPAPDYYIVSEYQMSRGSSFNQIKELLSDYEIIKEFRKDPEFFKIQFSHPENLPFDWYHPNPKILIWKKRT